MLRSSFVKSIRLCSKHVFSGRKNLIRSDGEEHLGSTLDPIRLRAFPGPTGKKGPPLRVRLLPKF